MRKKHLPLKYSKYKEIIDIETNLNEKEFQTWKS